MNTKKLIKNFNASNSIALGFRLFVSSYIYIFIAFLNYKMTSGMVYCLTSLFASGLYLGYVFNQITLFKLGYDSKKKPSNITLSFIVGIMALLLLMAFL